jgi:hypothetical protein
MFLVKTQLSFLVVTFLFLLNENKNKVNGGIFASLSEMVSLVEIHQMITYQLEDFIQDHEDSLKKAKE